jgi:4-hydroxy-tetrahydrodipicolinate synthase
MLKGSIPAIITPFSRGEVDFDSFAKLLKWQIKEGISGVTVCGTTGESPTLTHDEHMQLVEFAVKVSGRKIPVIAGTGSNSTKEAIEFTKHAYKSGADYGLVVTPYYNKPNQKGLVNHFKKIAKVTPLKQIIYNIPGRSIVDLSYDSFKELNKISNIVGIKDASNDLSRPLVMRTFMKKNFNFISGEDGTIAGYLAQGGHGCISVTANVAPRLTSKLHYYWQTKNYKQFDLINLKLAPLSQVLFSEPSPTPSKYALSLMGKCKADIGEPLTDLSPETKKQVRKVLKDLNFI